MNCAICKHGETQPGRVTIALDLPRGGTVVFQDVPAQVCDTCGERYFDETTTAHLLRLAKQTDSAGGGVEVRRYAAA